MSQVVDPTVVWFLKQRRDQAIPRARYLRTYTTFGCIFKTTVYLSIGEEDQRIASSGAPTLPALPREPANGIFKVSLNINQILFPE
ncbi:hypothetical protein II582_01030 [bacterium]|nr:hypothetical protein [bacterium]